MMEMMAHVVMRRRRRRRKTRETKRGREMQEKFYVNSGYGKFSQPLRQQPTFHHLKTLSTGTSLVGKVLVLQYYITRVDKRTAIERIITKQ